MADSFPTETQNVSVDVLIGNDYYWDLVESSKIQVSPGLYLIDSKFGWLLSGRMKSDQDTSTELSVFGKEISLSNISFQTDYEDKLSAFWNLEHIGIKDSAVENDDDRALQKFNDAIIFKNSRYYVTWPWKHFDRPFASNYTLALG